MLPKAQRLRSSRDFQRVYKRGRSYAHPLLVLYVFPTAGADLRIGFSISKKLGGAVDRNRIKRRLREICRARLAACRPGFDAVFVARSRCREAQISEMAAAVETLFRRAKLSGSRPATEDPGCGDSASG